MIPPKIIIFSNITIEIAMIINHIPFLFTKGLSNNITFKTNSIPSKISENKNRIIKIDASDSKEKVIEQIKKILKSKIWEIETK